MSLPISTAYRYITHVSEIAGGRPLIKGTRITVKAIVGYYKLGLSVEEMLISLISGGCLEKSRIFTLALCVINSGSLDSGAS